jgi:hypothetical protein
MSRPRKRNLRLLAHTRRPQTPTITRMDSMLRDEQRKPIDEFLRGPGWKFGWKSKRNTDEFSFWHKHFAGPIQSDRVSPPDLGAGENRLEPSAISPEFLSKLK